MQKDMYPNSDKFCIQGNVYSTAIGNDKNVTITLKKPYKNGNYIVCDNGYQTASGGDWGAGSFIHCIKISYFFCFNQ